MALRTFIPRVCCSSCIRNPAAAAAATPPMVGRVVVIVCERNRVCAGEKEEEKAETRGRAGRDESERRRIDVDAASDLVADAADRMACGRIERLAIVLFFSFFSLFTLLSPLFWLDVCEIADGARGKGGFAVWDCLLLALFGGVRCDVVRRSGRIVKTVTS